VRLRRRSHCDGINRKIVRMREMKRRRERERERREKPWHHAIGLNAMFETVEFPAGVSDLDPGLTDVNADDFSHFEIRSGRKGRKKKTRVRDLRFEESLCVSVFTNMTLKNGI